MIENRWSGQLESSRHKITGMKPIGALLLVAAGMLIALLGMDVLFHDATFAEAWQGAPHQIWYSMGSLMALAMQYKIASITVLIAIIAIVFLRRVPEVRSR